MSTIRNDSLKEGRSRLPIAPTTRGNFPQTVMFADVVDDTVNMTPAVLAPDGDYDFLVFAQDVPIVWKLGLLFTGVEQANDQSFSVRIPLRHFSMGGNPVFTPDDSEIPLYEHATGTTVTNGVAVSGYYGRAAIPDFGLVGAGLSGSGVVDCTTQGAIMYGYPEGRGTDTVLYSVFLEESAYTQAIKDNDNFDATGTIKVVGLYAAV